MYLDILIDDLARVRSGELGSNQRPTQ